MKKALLVDDEQTNLNILSTYMEDMGYDIVTAIDGVNALEKLKEHDDFDIILLDIMMPKMNGMEVWRHIKANDQWNHIPVIIQTASITRHQMMDGIKSGIFYCLKKPFSEEGLRVLVQSAIDFTKEQKKLSEEIDQDNKCEIFTNKDYHFTSLDETKEVALQLAHYFPSPKRAVMGILEMLINAIEHGNLGINYEEKKQLMLDGNWGKEIAQRLKNPAFNKKKVSITIKETDKEIVLTIKDDGEGFSWKPYMRLDDTRLSDPNGRGIATALAFSFDRIEYKKPGNEVSCIVELYKIKDLPEFHRKAPIIYTSKDTTISETIELMSENHVGSILIKDQDATKVEGIFTERDLMTRVIDQGVDVTSTAIADVMTTNPDTITPDTYIKNAVEAMLFRHYRHSIIVDDKENILNVLSLRDFLAQGWLRKILLQQSTGIDMKYQVGDIFLKHNQHGPISLSSDKTVKEAIHLMTEEVIGALPIIDENKLIGIFTERDLMSRVINKGLDSRTTILAEVMTENPDTVTSDTLVNDCIAMMALGKYRHILISDEEGRLDRILSMRDFMKLCVEIL